MWVLGQTKVNSGAKQKGIKSDRVCTLSTVRFVGIEKCKRWSGVQRERVGGWGSIEADADN